MKTVSIALIVLYALLGTVLAERPAGAKTPGRNERAPAFNLISTDNRRVSLSDMRGHVVVLNFWATWNPPSLEEVTVLKKVQTAYARSGVMVVGISADSKPTSDVKAFLRQFEVNYPVVHDAQRKACADYGVSTVPMTFIIDKGGIVRWVGLGYQPNNANDIVNQIKALL